MSRQNPGLDSTQIHKQLLPKALANGSALLLNHKPELLLIDNSEYQQRYHCRTSNFKAMQENPGHAEDAQDLQQMQAFMAREDAKA